MNEIVKRLNIPVKGNPEICFDTASGLPIAKGYKRIVIGDRGPYIEFGCNQLYMEKLHIPKQRHVYFTEWRTNDESNTMVYHQKRTVKYAEYIIGLYYISPSDLYIEGEPVMN